MQKVQTSLINSLITAPTELECSDPLVCNINKQIQNRVSPLLKTALESIHFSSHEHASLNTLSEEKYLENLN